MYELIDEAESRRYRNECSDVLTEACAALRERGINAQFVLVGSGARNLVTRNGNGPYDLDYNLEIINADAAYKNDLHRLKETVRTELNKANGFDFSDAHDSTSVLTCLLHFNDTPTLQFSFDVAIVARNSKGTLCRLIHNKNVYGFGHTGQYTWNEVPNSHNVSAKASAIKKAGLWLSVRERYVYLKNLYLERRDTDHPSFIVYVEAVNQIYDGMKPKTPAKPVKAAPVKTAPTPTKVEFNCMVQKAVSKSGQYDGKTISAVASLACENYSGKKNKKTVRNELLQKFGPKSGNDLYNRIVSLLK